MDVTVELGRNPVGKYQTQSEYEDKQADEGRECRNRLARLNSQARTWTGKYSFFPVQLATSWIVNLTRLILTQIVCRRYFQHAQFIPIVGAGKRGAY